MKALRFNVVVVVAEVVVCSSFRTAVFVRVVGPCAAFCAVVSTVLRLGLESGLPGDCVLRNVQTVVGERFPCVAERSLFTHSVIISVIISRFSRRVSPSLP